MPIALLANASGYGLRARCRVFRGQASTRAARRVRVQAARTAEAPSPAFLGQHVHGYAAKGTPAYVREARAVKGTAKGLSTKERAEGA